MDAHGIQTENEREIVPAPSESTASKAAIAGHPIHPMLIPFPIAFLSGAWITDLVFWKTGEAFWADFSFWLIAGGLLVGFLAALFGMIDFVGLHEARAHRAGWFHAVGNAIALVLSAINLGIRRDDSSVTIVPWGLIVSTCVSILLVFTGWFGGELSYRHKIRVLEK
ncbi:MAG: DUF2231 domain-containing protein [Nibricoccus sp.]